MYDHLYGHNSGLFLWTVKHQQILGGLFPCERKIIQYGIQESDMRAFLGGGQLGDFHYMLSRFVSESYWKHQVSLLAIVLGSRCEFDERLIGISSLHSFYSYVNIPGTNFAEIFIIPNSLANRLICISSAVVHLSNCIAYLTWLSPSQIGMWLCWTAITDESCLAIVFIAFSSTATCNSCNVSGLNFGSSLLDQICITFAVASYQVVLSTWNLCTY